jgi:hypothetical protein
VAHPHIIDRGFLYVRVSLDGPEEVIKWSRRLLFLTLFLLLMIVYPLWGFSITFPYIMAIATLIVTALFVVDEPESDMNIEDISDFDETRNEHDEHIAQL